MRHDNLVLQGLNTRNSRDDDSLVPCPYTASHLSNKQQIQKALMATRPPWRWYQHVHSKKPPAPLLPTLMHTLPLGHISIWTKAIHHSAFNSRIKTHLLLLLLLLDLLPGCCLHVIPGRRLCFIPNHRHRCSILLLLLHTPGANLSCLLDMSTALWGPAGSSTFASISFLVSPAGKSP